MNSAADLKSLSMRTKLLALHLIRDILDKHLAVFTMETTAMVSTGHQTEADTHVVTTLFINAVKQYLCLSLSRNLVSVVPPVFECALDIFAKVLGGLRNYLKVVICICIYNGFRKRLRYFSKKFSCLFLKQKHHRLSKGRR